LSSSWPRASATSTVEILCRWTSGGPPHRADTDAGYSYRHSTRECAILTGHPELADMRRSALERSFGVTVVSCDTAELERDPFAVAYRVVAVYAHEEREPPRAYGGEVDAVAEL
jgi:hypothetical protein